MVRKKAETPTTEEVAVEKTKKRVRHSYLFAVGRRKHAIARTRLFKNGDGTIEVNGKPYTTYFPTQMLQNTVIEPLTAIGGGKDIKVTIKVAGGGVHGQAEACRHGIARAILKIEKDYRTTLKPLGYLKRDPRRKERKKPGLKRARRAPQWAKR